jgi:broad specificity phosphatase PhoE
VVEPVRLGFLRHGDVAGAAHVYRGVTDTPLNDAGWQQMRAFVAAMPGWQTVVSSPLVRCADFARDYARHHNVKCTLDAVWRELDFGAWEGLRPTDVAAHDPAAHGMFTESPRGNPPPGGESLDAFDARIHAALHALGDAATQPTLIVTHAGVMRAVLAEVLGLADDYRARIALTPGSGFVLSWLAGAPPLLMELRCAA